MQVLDIYLSNRSMVSTHETNIKVKDLCQYYVLVQIGDTTCMLLERITQKSTHSGTLIHHWQSTLASLISPSCSLGWSRTRMVQNRRRW